MAKTIDEKTKEQQEKYKERSSDYNSKGEGVIIGDDIRGNSNQHTVPLHLLVDRICAAYFRNKQCN